ncbi:uncharacterized protein LAJ45_10565 [Morchella importuna]|uniref:uncharacterized protein n=1 Tax=Morchella importuna TaxID=1174673 RepID=UPI001E8D1435|nr:uncharacterized protein LAJ45_10565 [Morchella importuna]KAH8145443.1 hypothetical protein LAJ45_10565 [Morchella importuna]
MYPKALLAFLATFLLFFTTIASPILEARQEEGIVTFDAGDASESQGTTETSTGTNTLSSSTLDWYQIWFYQYNRSLWCNKRCCNFHLISYAWVVGYPSAVIWSGPQCTGTPTYLSGLDYPVFLSGEYYSMSPY